jgi:hypothetical protein
MWDERYASVDFAYGREPNDFLVEAHAALEDPRAGRAARALCLAEGEGRNGVYLARHGWDVTGVDLSQVGLDKFTRWAEAEALTVRAVRADLAEFDLGTACWELIVSIWCHVPPVLRRDLHARIVRALAPGGALILEAYHPRQLALGTGGPRSEELMMTLSDLRAELAGLDLLVARELEREVHEGPFHAGPSAVVQVLARKPA